jgi:hypothetical protein
VTPAELEVNKQSFIRRFPSQFETVGQISNQLANLVVYGLPDNYYSDYISRVNAVTLDDVNRVANRYLDPSKMAIVIVGDRKSIEPGLKELGYDITLLDTGGKSAGELTRTNISIKAKPVAALPFLFAWVRPNFKTGGQALYIICSQN